MIHMRSFTSHEEKNMKYLVSKGIEYTLVQITETGYKKSILDATDPMRAYFLAHHVHDYSSQIQGPENKVCVETYIVSDSTQRHTQTSFYRPVTKKGDPRLWIYGIKEFCSPDDILAILYFQRTLYAFNFTKLDIYDLCEAHAGNPVQELLREIQGQSNIISKELLGLLKGLSATWLVSEVNADTGIGRTIETLLGIPMNSSKLPDYKGIELKSFRDKRPNIRNTLFCKAPDWDISNLKSSKEIVQKYGYISKGIQSYRNTLKVDKPNSQGLSLSLRQIMELLTIEDRQLHDKIFDVAVWRLQNLHTALLTKHKETFWIATESRIEDGKEWFRLSKIEHTKNPLVSQFDLLLEQGYISVDLLLGRPKGRGDTFSFKITKKAKPMLFPDSETFLLNSSI